MEGGQTKNLQQKAANGEIGVKINGAARTVPAGMSLRQVLEWLEVETERVAVELNRAIVRKADWEKAPVEAGAEIEIVMFVGGGRR